jgi:hypothetical protein
VYPSLRKVYARFTQGLRTLVVVRKFSGLKWFTHVYAMFMQVYARFTQGLRTATNENLLKQMSLCVNHAIFLNVYACLRKFIHVYARYPMRGFNRSYASFHIYWFMFKMNIYNEFTLVLRRVCAKFAQSLRRFTQGLRRVYTCRTHGLRRVYACLRRVYARAIEV